MDWTAASVNDLRAEIGRVAAMVVQLTQVVVRQVDDVAEYRREILRIYSRMEQQDARIEQMSREFRARMAEHDARFEQQSAEIAELRRDTRRILDAMERRGGDGGPREP
jgi:methyl-accepting chemotaxis protein